MLNVRSVAIMTVQGIGIKRCQKYIGSYLYIYNKKVELVS